MGIQLMVSVWPLVDYRSENYKEMKARGFLLRSDRGFPIGMNYMGNTVPYDAFNPDARAYVWDKIKRIIMIKESESSGWMKRNQNLQFMIMISSGIMKDHIFPMEIIILWNMQKLFMREWKEKGRKIS